MTPAAPERDRPPPIKATEFGWTYRTRSEPAVERISFHLPPGELLLVLGPSGSGKSTLARALAGLVPHAMPGHWSGTLEIGELSVPETRPGVLGAHVGLVFQDPESQLVMSRVEDEVAFGLEQRGWPLERMRRRVPEALRMVGLEGFERRSTMRLSGGEQQRLAIADVIAPSPGVLVFDEPTANLDPPGMEATFERIGALAAAGDHTIVVIEHRVDAILPFADRVLLLDERGRQIAFGTPDEVGPRFATRLARVGSWVPVAWTRWIDEHVSSRATDLDVQVAEAPQPGEDPSSAEDPRCARADRADRADRTDPGSSIGTVGPSVDEPRSRRGAGERIRVIDLTVTYPSETEVDRVALSHLSLAIPAGIRVALVGPNGSGKSTLLDTLAGIRRPSAGRVAISIDEDARVIDPAALGSADLARLIGFVFQDPELGFVARTVREEVHGSQLVPRRRSIRRFGMAVRGSADRAVEAPDRADVLRQAQALLERFGLEALADRDPFTLSQGEQRRLSIAAACWLTPPLLLLDEPTFGLDRRGSANVIALLDRLRSEGQTQIMASHDPRLFPSCDAIIALNEGRIAFQGDPGRFLADPPYRPADPWRRVRT